jgi:CRP-like cAMP-binding protein
MNSETLFARLLELLPSETMHLQKKKFYTFDCGPDRSILLVTSGLLMTVRSAEDGRYIGTALCEPNTIVGFSGFYDAAKEVTFYAIESTTVKLISTQQMNQLLQKDTELCYAMLIWLSKRHFTLLDDLEACALLPLEERIAFFENKIKSLEGPPAADISNVCLSIALGVHPVSVSRVLKKPKKKTEK